ncbi:hypothetical protein M4R22_02935 [Acidovorax sp. GBBC 3334]|uniref:hypothetical protein n=1 Tax=Acidovorax sp. GBBC 3334 TaxID=2940496 RepID=UPI00230312C6|nr:hypothetical protein [Acidovorax sp. GBBC 3334]MDA8453711.1 hypothetical protein [Acidovorax sp. GBBC 3334]
MPSPPPSLSRTSSGSSLQSFFSAIDQQEAKAPQRRSSSSSSLPAPADLQTRVSNTSAEASGSSRPRVTSEEMALQRKKSQVRLENQAKLQQHNEQVKSQLEMSQTSNASLRNPEPAAPSITEDEDIFFDTKTSQGDSEESSMLGSSHVDSSLGDPSASNIPRMPPRRPSVGSNLGTAGMSQRTESADRWPAGTSVSTRFGNGNPPAHGLGNSSRHILGLSGPLGASGPLEFRAPTNARTFDEASRVSTAVSVRSSVVSNVTHAIHADPDPADIENPATDDAPQAGPPTWGDTLAALGATAGQRAATYFGAHAGAWVLQAASVAILAGASKEQPSREAIANLSNIVGGASSAVLKEAIGETMKTVPSLGATISLPGATALQREGPRVMAGFNDMWTAIAAAMTNVAVNAEIRPMIEKALTDRGIPPEVALPMSMMASAFVQRMISASADTVSDLTSTMAKSFLPGARAGNVVNPQIDKQTMLGGITARGLINFGLTLPLGPLITLRKIMSGNDNDFQRSTASNAMAWAGLNGWIVAKAHISSFYKSLGATATEPSSQPQSDVPIFAGPENLDISTILEQDENRSGQSSP